MYRFCPQCAHELEVRPVHGRDLPTCPQCGFVHYNNSRPCVGVFVVDRGRVLLVERAVEPFKGYWDAPGGFLDTGEHPAAGAVRELQEETGLEIEPTEVLGFFMDTYGDGIHSPGDDIHTLNIGYLARLLGGQARAGDDAASLRWFPLDALPDKIAFVWLREALRVLQERMRE